MRSFTELDAFTFAIRGRTQVPEEGTRTPGRRYSGSGEGERTRLPGRGGREGCTRVPVKVGKFERERRGVPKGSRLPDLRIAGGG